MGTRWSVFLPLFLLIAGMPVHLFAQNPKEIGTVVTAQGAISARDAAGTVRSLERRGAVHEGDVLVVPVDGFVSLRMVDNAHLSLGPATELSLESYRYDGRAGTRDSVVLNLQRGCFRTRVGGAGTAARDEYRIDTPMASIDLDGSFHGAAIIGDRLYTATWQGSAVVSNALGSISLGNYGDYEYSRTLPGEAPKGLFALLPEAACEPPETLDGKVEPYRLTARDKDDDHADDENDGRGLMRSRRCSYCCRRRCRRRKSDTF